MNDATAKLAEHLNDKFESSTGNTARFFKIYEESGNLACAVNWKYPPSQQDRDDFDKWFKKRS